MISRTIYGTDEARGWRPWGALVPFLALAFVALSVVGLTVALQRFHLVDANETPIGRAGLMAFLLVPFTALALIVMAWTRLVERRSLASIGLARKKAARTFAFGVLTGVVMTAAIVAGGWFVGAYSAGTIAIAFHSPSGLAAIAALLACFCVQSSAEEILFRGWMLSAIAAKFGTIAGVLISSLVFVLMHFEARAGWLFDVNVFLFAVMACCWSIRTGNIWSVMGWHAGWNWLLAVGFEMPVTGLDGHVPALLVKMTPHGAAYLTGGFEGPEGSAMCSVVLLIAIAVLGPWRRKAA
jgi:membrane protease YdiL (CAAX protease family)